MKSTYRIAVKTLCRTRFRDFIRENFSEARLAAARVLCFPGPEALEIFEIYDVLGIPRKNIVCLEMRRAAFNELRRRKLGVALKRQRFEVFLDSPARYPFDVVSLDFTGQLGSYEKYLYRLKKRGFLADDAIVFTNFCGAREADVSKGYYYCARQKLWSPNAAFVAASIMDEWRETGFSIDALSSIFDRNESRIPPPFWGESVSDQRGGGIHETVRSALTVSSSVLIDLLFKQRIREGSLSQEVLEFWDREFLKIEPQLPPDATRAFRRARKANARMDDTMPNRLSVDLAGEVETQMRELVKGFAQHIEPVRFNVDRMARALLRGVETFLRPPSLVLATQSYKYVSDRGTPMYADMFRLRRVAEFDFLGAFLPKNPGSVAEVFEPLCRLSLLGFLRLMGDIRQHSIGLATAENAAPATPSRIDLGRESAINPQTLQPALDASSMRARAITLLSAAPHLTIEDVALSVGARPMQVAAWKAHMTMGTYSKWCKQAKS
jgi:hypothetical protein